MKQVILMILVLLILSTGICAAEDAASPGIVRGESFELVDAQGTVTARLYTEEDGRPVLIMYGLGGTPRIVMGIAKDDGAEFKLTDVSGKVRLACIVNSNGDPSISMFDENGAEAATIKVEPDGIPFCQLKRKVGDEEASATLSVSDAPELALRAGEGKNYAILRSEANGASSLSLGDADNTKRTNYKVDEYGFPSLTFFNSEGKPILEIEQDENNLPCLSLSDSYGTKRILMGLDGEYEEPYLRLTNDNTDEYMELAVSHTGKSSICLYHKDSVRAGIDVSDSGVPGIHLLDAAGQERASLILTNGELPKLTFQDAQGRTVWSAPEK